MAIGATSMGGSVAKMTCGVANSGAWPLLCTCSESIAASSEQRHVEVRHLSGPDGPEIAR